MMMQSPPSVQQEYRESSSSGGNSSSGMGMRTASALKWQCAQGDGDKERESSSSASSSSSQVGTVMPCDVENCESESVLTGSRLGSSCARDAEDSKRRAPLMRRRQVVKRKHWLILQQRLIALKNAALIEKQQQQQQQKRQEQRGHQKWQEQRGQQISDALHSPVNMADQQIDTPVSPSSPATVAAAPDTASHRSKANGKERSKSRAANEKKDSKKKKKTTTSKNTIRSSNETQQLVKIQRKRSKIKIARNVGETTVPVIVIDDSENDNDGESDDCNGSRKRRKKQISSPRSSSSSSSSFNPMERVPAPPAPVATRSNHRRASRFPTKSLLKGESINNRKRRVPHRIMDVQDLLDEIQSQREGDRVDTNSNNIQKQKKQSQQRQGHETAQATNSVTEKEATASVTGGDADTVDTSYRATMHRNEQTTSGSVTSNEPQDWFAGIRPLEILSPTHPPPPSRQPQRESSVTIPTGPLDDIINIQSHQHSQQHQHQQQQKRDQSALLSVNGNNDEYDPLKAIFDEFCT